MKLRLGIIVSFLVAGAVLAPSAVAQKPIKEPFVSEPVEFSAGEVCPFPVRIETIAGNQSSKTFPDGRMLVTGRATERVTNLATGESIDVKTRGSALFDPLPGDNLRIVVRGHGVIFLFARDVGGPALIATTGRVDEVLDLTTDTITSFRLSGQRRDLCAELAS
jgi:hypothetical protein